MPKITILEKTNLKEDHWHSMVISLLRGFAALQVAAAHLRALQYPGFSAVEKPPLLFLGLAFSSGFAYLAVIVFFVLSGWLVGGSFLNKLNSERAFQHYAIDRTGRFFANFSFTLYVLHVPMILVMGYALRSVFGIGQLSPHSMLHYLIYAGMYLMLVVGAYLFYLPFESNTPRVRQWLKAQLFARVGIVRP
ncbi:hypothetical protein AB595_24690 [Massilia sp. WF1]|uniref:hypothetical protein n=1 Tax=unclassified Massilia TaxID=2609279 RepID=UPI00068EB25F|nr:MULTISPECIES: hypothetical protein [unclassified Massilia]ALK97715.1 hypothetical protein AM586_17375 [Massilia sp. WG5]KNZ67705.1 hypothetical protein AB595_24690 [Massilia sp. WF1]